MFEKLNYDCFKRILFILESTFSTSIIVMKDLNKKYYYFIKAQFPKIKLNDFLCATYGYHNILEWYGKYRSYSYQVKKAGIKCKNLDTNIFFSNKIHKYYCHVIYYDNSIEYLHPRTCCNINCIYSFICYAIKYDNLAIIKYFHQKSNDLFFNTRLAIFYNRLRILKWYVARYRQLFRCWPLDYNNLVFAYYRNPNIYHWIIKSGYFDLHEFVKNSCSCFSQGIITLIEYNYNLENKYDVVRMSITAHNYELFKFLIQNGYHIDKKLYLEANNRRLITPELTNMIVFQ